METPSKYFTEFGRSDNTDPVERIYISTDELAYCQQAVANRIRLQPAVMGGGKYRQDSFTYNHNSSIEIGIIAE